MMHFRQWQFIQIIFDLWNFLVNIKFQYFSFLFVTVITWFLLLYIFITIIYTQT